MHGMLLICIQERQPAAALHTTSRTPAPKRRSDERLTCRTPSSRATPSRLASAAANTAAAAIGDAAAGTDTTTAAQTVAIAAAEEAAAIATNLEGEISRLQLLLIAERAATAAATDAAEANTVFVPGNVIPMTQLQALHCQVERLHQQQFCAAASDAQYSAHSAQMAETTSSAETARATTGPVPAIANGPSRVEHTRPHPGAPIAKS